MNEDAIKLPMLEIDLEEKQYEPGDKKPEEVLCDLNLLRRELDRYRDAYIKLRDASHELYLDCCTRPELQQKAEAIKRLILPRVGDVKEKDAEILALYHQLTKHTIRPPDNIPESVETLRDLVNSAYRILKFSELDHFQENPGYKWEMGRLLVHIYEYTTLLNKIPSKPVIKCMDCDKEITDDDIIETASQTEYLTLCQPCYLKRGNTVR